jgi:hypothetical protein
MMDRRSFLRRVIAGLAGTAVLSTIDVDKFLWMPGEKSFFFFPPDNGFVTVEWITREALRSLANKLQFATHINRHYDGFWLDDQASKLGHTVNVRVPSRFEGTGDDGLAAVTLDHQFTVEDRPLFASDPPRSRTRAATRREFIEPAARLMQAEIERLGLDTFGALRLPDGAVNAAVVYGHEEGLSVRGVEAYDAYEGRTRLRLDFLGGSSGRRCTED